MKKKLLGTLLTLTLLFGSSMMAMAATSASCNHSAGTYPEGNGAPFYVTYTHPVCVAYQPNGDPILVDCTATDTRQNLNHYCKECGALVSTSVRVMSTTHSISH